MEQCLFLCLQTQKAGVIRQVDFTLLNHVGMDCSKRFVKAAGRIREEGAVSWPEVGRKPVAFRIVGAVGRARRLGAGRPEVCLSIQRDALNAGGVGRVADGGAGAGDSGPSDVGASDYAPSGENPAGGE